jgi:DNA repair protein RadC
MKKTIKIENPNHIAEALRRWAKRRNENFIVLTLNGMHEIIGIHHITKGLVNKTIVHPREVFYPAIKDNAVSVAFVHNHPSNQAYPSNEDDAITKRLCMAAKILGFNVLDHLIITKNGDYFSYRANERIDEKYFVYGDAKSIDNVELEKFTDEIAAENNN